MKKVSVSELKNQLSAYLQSVQGGETVIGNDRNRPVARMTGRSVWARSTGWGAASLLLLALAGASVAEAQVYRWVDEEGVTHLSSEKPPAGVKAERIDIKTSGSSKGPSGGAGARSASGSNQPAPRPASPEQIAGREQLLGQLKTRECVIALEALDRKTAGAEPTTATEIKRLKQTAELNCSPDPVRRRQQEEMAARLRVANSPSCVEARNRLGDMMTPGSRATREDVRAQQAFVDEHCTSPIR
jgi:prevent-host-death family protein